jgi:chlorobactene glucosyltransferase
MLELFLWMICGFLLTLLVIQSINIRLFDRPQRDRNDSELPFLSILVPARNEERSIRECITSLLAQRYDGEIEVLVLDDESTDRTSELLQQLSLASARLRVLKGAPLPPGWNGKLWACHQLAQEAQGEWLLFTDADTEHHASSAESSVSTAMRRGIDLLSLMPRQRTGTALEHLVVPLLNFYVVTLFPQFMLERTGDERFHAANGQFLLFHRKAYDAIGGHAKVRSTVVDDLSLAREIRRARLRLAVLDGSRLVECRMYRSGREVVEGFTKNSYAALRSNRAVFAVTTLFLLTVFVVPPIALIVTRSFEAMIATLLGLWLRLRVSVRMLERVEFALLHPVSILLSTALLMRSMWYARNQRTVEWKNRPVQTSEE